LTVLTGGVTARADRNFGTPIPGRHVYDRTGVLTAAEMADLEMHARAVQQAGAVVIVYLRARDATVDQTVQDARDLMTAWDVQSRPNAHDGLVIFLNLQPGNPRHGQVALYAGARHYQGGHLPQNELQRIADQVMRPLLQQGRTAAGIAAGLDAAAHSLMVGPPSAPTPGPVQRTASELARVPLNVAAILLTLGLAVLCLGAWRARPVAPATGLTSLAPPDALAPALVGALVAGRLDDRQIVATILDLARRGALTLEPAGTKKVQVRLLDHGLVGEGYEESVWQSLAERADQDGVIASRDLAKVRAGWRNAREALRREVQAREWYDPAAGARRRPLYLAGTVALLLAVVAFAITGIGREIWGIPGSALLLAGSIVAYVLGYSLPATTAQGEQVAAAWRGYRTGLKMDGRDTALTLDLDAAMPYAVAMGVVGSLDKRLKEASARGDAPAWLGHSIGARGWEGGFYPYWIAFYASAVPSSSGAGGAGGAAAGGGGAGASF
jgi:uncharacterized membrane protein YgcG